MNKIQIKAEILATIAAFTSVSVPDPALLTDLKNIEDKKTVFDILIKELVNSNEHKTLIVCWLLTELIDKDKLNDELWDVIKSPDYTDHIKMVAFNLLKDLGSKVDYEVISDYFEKFDELINKETQDLLDSAIMNPEAQIDFMDFLSSLTDDDKKMLIRSLEDDYAGDALANIVIPVYLYYMNSEISDTALDVLSKTKSQLAYHALDNVMRFVDEATRAKVNKALSAIKLSGIRVDNTLDFYKEILKDSKPYKCYVSFPDGHGNLALIFSRKRDNKTLQFLASVINPRYGILDAFGFNSMTEQDFYKIVDKFYNYQEKYEIDPGVLKYLLTQSVANSYINKEVLPYEYICWESILLDVEQVCPDVDLEQRELNQKDIDKLCLSDFVQNWFFDEVTSSEFNTFIEKLSNEFKTQNFNVDLDKFIADNFDLIFDEDEKIYQMVKFNTAAYLRYLKGDKEFAQILYSLEMNYAFLTNIIRKSIYEYYISKRYILKNQRKATNLFEQRLQPKSDDFELLQLDMIISSIEAKWVDNA